jgi:hypothetical protein
MNCSSLTGISLVNGLDGIGYRLFDGCSSLTNITIPESVTSIMSYAFSGCSGLTNITIPASVVSIGEGVFENCDNLRFIVLSKDSPLDRDIFLADVKFFDDDDALAAYLKLHQIWKGINKNVMILSACILVGLAGGVLILIRIRKERAKRIETDGAA